MIKGTKTDEGFKSDVAVFGWIGYNPCDGNIILTINFYCLPYGVAILKAGFGQRTGNNHCERVAQQLLFVSIQNRKAKAIKEGTVGITEPIGLPYRIISDHIATGGLGKSDKPVDTGNLAPKGRTNGCRDGIGIARSHRSGKSE